MNPFKVGDMVRLADYPEDKKDALIMKVTGVQGDKVTVIVHDTIILDMYAKELVLIEEVKKQPPERGWVKI